MKTDLHPEFMPWWTKAKEYYGEDMPSFVKQDGESHELLSGSCCFIGEVYHWSSEWVRKTGILWWKKKEECKTCERFGMNEFSTARRMTVEQFYDWKHKIYQHVEEAHPELLK